MSGSFATLVVAALLGSEALGKSVTGLFGSEAARQQKGQFITKFMYQGNVEDADVKMTVTGLVLGFHFKHGVT